jgi:hypothetical protein
MDGLLERPAIADRRRPLGVNTAHQLLIYRLQKKCRPRRPPRVSGPGPSTREWPLSTREKPELPGGPPRPPAGKSYRHSINDHARALQYDKRPTLGVEVELQLMDARPMALKSIVAGLGEDRTPVEPRRRNAGGGEGCRLPPITTRSRSRGLQRRFRRCGPTWFREAPGGETAGDATGGVGVARSPGGEQPEGRN